MTKFIFITGGVVSSIGKGISAASLGRLLKARGLKLSILKMDPYINVDAGTMNPYQHGEVFVTEDGAETDLDLGHYERFIDLELRRDSNITTGQIYGNVIAKERQGEYLGGTVQVIPHITDEIKRLIRVNAERAEADIAIVEVGGTVGDIEGLPFLEAIRQFRREIPPSDSISIHVTLVPTVGPQREVKTKPTQHSVRELRSVGIHADMLVARTKHEINEEQRNKISLFCDLPPDAVFAAMDTDEIYEIPLVLERQGFSRAVCSRLGLSVDEPDLSEWESLVKRCRSLQDSVRIAIVGKYVETGVDTYLSVVEALKHAGIANGVAVEVDWVNAGDLEVEEMAARLSEHDGVLVPGGFGHRGIESKIEAIRYAREDKVPFFGLCLGLQCAVIEHARNVCGLRDAHSTEFNKESPHPVIALLAEQHKVADLGGTMRLGACECYLQPETLARRCYGRDVVYERHRHRYEVNNEYRSRLGEAGLRFSGMSPNGQLVEIVELPDHPFFLATQFHPEFKSRPTSAHPLFREFIAAAKARRQGATATADAAVSSK
ncbi:MAG: CTP synthase [Armatimonadetes bacterium]|nr:CTP synthase [Armatimonadota bacterium]